MKKELWLRVLEAGVFLLLLLAKDMTRRFLLAICTIWSGRMAA